MSFEVMFFKDDREMFYLGNPWDAIDHFVCRCARMFKPSSDREFFVPKEVRNSDDPEDLKPIINDGDKNSQQFFVLTHSAMLYMYNVLYPCWGILKKYSDRVLCQCDEYLESCDDIYSASVEDGISNDDINRLADGVDRILDADLKNGDVSLMCLSRLCLFLDYVQSSGCFDSNDAAFIYFRSW